MTYTIAALYRFVRIDDVPALRAELKAAFAALNICGTLLIAPEGINGTLAGSAQAIDAMLAMLEQRTGLPRDEVKFSTADTKPFDRLKIRAKKEIITLKVPSVDPTRRAGTYVAAKDWNALLDDPEIVVLDTRNVYETRIGTFDKAVVPPLDNFSAFADYVRKELNPATHKKVAMFCTGGIRCEKASAFMLEEGFADVYHLKGGILKYLEDVPPEQSKWKGDCYVFDRRMAVGHGLKPADYVMCFSCGDPLDTQARQHALYEEGVSCAACHAQTSEADKARFRMRHAQIMRQAA